MARAAWFVVSWCLVDRVGPSVTKMVCVFEVRYLFFLPGNAAIGSWNVTFCDVFVERRCLPRNICCISGSSFRRVNAGCQGDTMPYVVR